MPAKLTLESRPPIVTIGKVLVVDSEGNGSPGCPSSGRLVTSPRPVQKIKTKSPRFTGCATIPWLPAGAAKVLLLAINTAPCPVPAEFKVKIPGVWLERLRATGAPATPPDTTVTL